MEPDDATEIQTQLNWLRPQAHKNDAWEKSSELLRAWGQNALLREHAREDNRGHT